MGVYSFPVTSPGVPKGTSRLRFFLSAAHERAQIDTALDAVTTILDRS
jgi:7-keto-8-aminopelargonate synthetase-like enzyme